MRRWMVGGGAFLLILWAGSAASAGRNSIERKTYEASHGFSAYGTVNVYWMNILDEPPRSVAPRWARSVSIRIIDDSGLPVGGQVVMDAGPRGVHSIEVCGSTPEPLPLAHRADIEVVVMGGTCGTGVSLPTSGMVSFEYAAR